MRMRYFVFLNVMFYWSIVLFSAESEDALVKKEVIKVYTEQSFNNLIFNKYLLLKEVFIKNKIVEDIGIKCLADIYRVMIPHRNGVLGDTVSCDSCDDDENYIYKFLDSNLKKCTEILKFNDEQYDILLKNINIALIRERNSDGFIYIHIKGNKSYGADLVKVSTMIPRFSEPGSSRVSILDANKLENKKIVDVYHKNVFWENDACYINFRLYKHKTWKGMFTISLSFNQVKDMVKVFEKNKKCLLKMDDFDNFNIEIDESIIPKNCLYRSVKIIIGLIFFLIFSYKIGAYPRIQAILKSL